MNFWKYMGFGTELGGILLAPPIVGVLLGRWIDRTFKTDPAWTFGLLVLGILSGLWSMVKHLKGIGR